MAVALTPLGTTSGHFGGWYIAPHNSGIFDQAQEAFDRAAEIFSTKLTKDESKRLWLRGSAAGLLDVQKAVAAAKETYDSKGAGSKARIWLAKFSARVVHYGSVMDVLVQHHPEYVALAWGAMRFLFLAVVNQEELISTLSKALAEIADALPRVELSTVLYPNESMKQLVATLYAHIIRFFIWAMDWYKEGPLLHILHSVTRPSALRFKDILEEVRDCSRRVDQLAISSAQAEQRDMHAEQRDMRKFLLDFKEMVINHQAINSAAILDTNQRVCDLQFSQILTFTASTPLLDPTTSLNYCLFMRHRRRQKHADISGLLWQSQKLQKWGSTVTSSLIVIRASFTTRHAIKDFATEVISILNQKAIPVIWTLKTHNEARASAAPNLIDILKQLILQALRINPTILTERTCNLNAARFQSARTESQWLDLLTSALAGLPQIYVIVDTEILKTNHAQPLADFSWSSAFQNIFLELARRGFRTVVRVLLLADNNSFLLGSPSSSLSPDTIISMDNSRRMGNAFRRARPERRRQGGWQAIRAFRPIPIIGH